MAKNLDHADPDPAFAELKAPYLKLYSLNTPNGQKITIYLELLELKYHERTIDITTNIQKDAWFIALNPNGRIPVISDVDAAGKQTVVWETGTILQYLGEKYDTERKYYHSLDAGKVYWEQCHWLTFQIASHGPMQGQANHFLKFCKEDIPYAKKRYQDETERIFGVYEIRLKENNGWLVGDKLNIADMAAWPWVKSYAFIGIDISKFPCVKKWVDKIAAIPEVQRGITPKKK